jgi:phosphatidylserine decarboxylase
MYGIRAGEPCRARHYLFGQRQRQFVRVGASAARRIVTDWTPNGAANRTSRVRYQRAILAANVG